MQRLTEWGKVALKVGDSRAAPQALGHFKVMLPLLGTVKPTHNQ